MNASSFFKNGWIRFPFDPNLENWVKHTLPYARRAVSAPENQQWLRCGGTWFAGVNVLKNNEQGQVGHGPLLQGIAIQFIREELGFTQLNWDKGQISICYPGYPKPMEPESEAAFRYRLNRDASHVDGLLPEGPDRRRYLREHHAFILGIPLVEAGQGASPVVVWQGSHDVIRQRFQQIYVEKAPADWAQVDITEVYQQTRRHIFDQCRRIEVSAKPGECYLIHRLALHGVSPWQKMASSSEDGRMICYFRPELSEPEHWLNNP